MQAAHPTNDKSVSPKSKVRPLSWFMDISIEMVALLCPLPAGSH